MHKTFLSIAALLGALAVIAGAFGAHGLKPRVNADTLGIFETAVRYQFYHVFALLATGILCRYFPHKALVFAGWCFIAGIGLFSGSLYIMVGFRVSALEFPRLVGILTPLGGLLLIAGWIGMFVGVLKGVIYPEEIG